MPACERCHEFFQYNSYLTRHKNRKNPCNKRYKCDLCNHIFRDKYNLNTHLNKKKPCVDQTETENKNKKENAKIQNINNININDNSKNINITNIINHIYILNPDHKIYHDNYFLKSNNIDNLNISDGIVNELNNSIRKDNLYAMSKPEFKYFEFLEEQLINDIGCKDYIYKLINIICINSAYPENLIIIYDRYREKLLIKDDIIKELDTIILNLLYKLLKRLYEHKELNDNLKKVYKIYIDRYEFDGFKNCNPKFIKQYENDIYIELCKLEKEIIDKFKRIQNGIDPEILHKDLYYEVTY